MDDFVLADTTSYKGTRIWHVTERQAKARLGVARRGEVWQGMAIHSITEVWQVGTDLVTKTDIKVEIAELKAELIKCNVWTLIYMTPSLPPSSSYYEAGLPPVRLS